MCLVMFGCMWLRVGVLIVIVVLVVIGIVASGYFVGEVREELLLIFVLILIDVGVLVFEDVGVVDVVWWYDF